MMTYLKFSYIDSEYVCYEYGKNKDEMIGTIKASLTDKKDCSFSFYDGSGYDSFNIFTGAAIGMIYRFIENGEFPKTYTYAAG